MCSYFMLKVGDFVWQCVRNWQEEQSREHEQLKFVCKCSFLEIYNEHITDLLEPSSTNLQVWSANLVTSRFLFHSGYDEASVLDKMKHLLAGRQSLEFAIAQCKQLMPFLGSQIREDSKTGVYVENLKEVEVTCVQDVVQLLVQVSIHSPGVLCC